MDHMETCIQDIENAHATLGLRPFAQEEEIRQVWRAKVRQNHPDHGGSAEAFRSIQEAAEILLKDGAREYYEAESCPTAASPVRTQTTSQFHIYRSVAKPEPSRPRTRRHLWLLAGAVFGYLIAPHLNQFGVTWVPLRDVSELMRYLDPFFLIGWFFVKKRVH
jgi:curved DNA-binding protein CbpA